MAANHAEERKTPLVSGKLSRHLILFYLSPCKGELWKIYVHITLWDHGYVTDSNGPMIF